jgi:hypothetical protein
MKHHIKKSNRNFSRSRELKLLIEQGSVTLAGNKKLKIYGTLHCKSGKRMKIENRVFFASEKEAIAHNYRPCKHCLKSSIKFSEIYLESSY